ncbi:MAG: insulinase family protein [Proteobacteria bacterium]|nr:insulinase family protein [Pseudomonadota bacterium]
MNHVAKGAYAAALTLAALTLATTPTPVAAAGAKTGTSAQLTPVRKVEGITEYRLANGLQVLLVPDDAKPTTTVNVTYHVGSRHENYGETGMAHLLEHLIFKGTPTYPKVWDEFSKRGLRANGTTWLDRTNYFASFTANPENLRWYLNWQADAMVNSFIARKDLDSEMTVVRNEMEMGENSPESTLFEKTLATMYQWHNYGKSTIGARADVENVDIARLQGFYRTYYQPDNATLIVTGKFDAAQVMQWVQQSFGKLPKPRRTLPTLYTLDAVQDGERGVTLRRVGGTPLLFAGYHLPPGADPDYAAFDVLARALTDAPAGRLHKALVETGLAASVGSMAMALHDPGFALFMTQLAPGQDMDKARDALVATLEGLAAQPLTEAELARAKARWIKDWEVQFADPEEVGTALSEFIAQGDWRLFFLTRDRVNALTLGDLNRVAAAYLLAANRTLGIYVPTDKPQRAPAPANVDVAAQFKGYAPVAEVAKVEAFDATPAHIDASTRLQDVAPGLRVALLPKGTRGDVVVAQLELKAGNEAALQGQEAVADMLVALLDKGTRTLTRQQVQDQLTALKAEVRWGGGPTGVTAVVQTTRANLPAVIALVAQQVREPALPADALEEVRRQMLAGLAAQAQEPTVLVEVALGREGNPYPRGDVRHMRAMDEAIADAQAVTLAQVQAFHARFIGAGNAQFAAVGAMDEAAVKAALTQAFQGWAQPVAFARVPLPLISVPAKRIVIETPDKQNAYLGARLPLPIKYGDADQAALMVANDVFGGGGNGRLWKRIREKEGLSYGVYSGVRFAQFESNSTWLVQAIFAPQNRAKVEAAFNEELERALKDGFTATEVAESRNGILNTRKLNRAQDPVLSGDLARNLYVGRTFKAEQALDDAIAAVTPEQASAAWRKYIDRARLVLAVGGDFKGQ